MTPRATALRRRRGRVRARARARARHRSAFLCPNANSPKARTRVPARTPSTPTPPRTPRAPPRARREETRAPVERASRVDSRPAPRGLATRAPPRGAPPRQPPSPRPHTRGRSPPSPRGIDRRVRADRRCVRGSHTSPATLRRARRPQARRTNRLRRPLPRPRRRPRTSRSPLLLATLAPVHLQEVNAKAPQKLPSNSVFRFCLFSLRLSVDRF